MIFVELQQEMIAKVYSQTLKNDYQEYLERKNGKDM